jgi:hypothetical protein
MEIGLWIPRNVKTFFTSHGITVFAAYEGFSSTELITQRDSQGHINVILTQRTLQN